MQSQRDRQNGMWDDPANEEKLLAILLMDPGSCVECCVCSVTNTEDNSNELVIVKFCCHTYCLHCYKKHVGLLCKRCALMIVKDNGYRVVDNELIRKFTACDCKFDILARKRVTVTCDTISKKSFGMKWFDLMSCQLLPPSISKRSNFELLEEFEQHVATIKSAMIRATVSNTFTKLFHKSQLLPEVEKWASQIIYQIKTSPNQYRYPEISDNLCLHSSHNHRHQLSNQTDFLVRSSQELFNSLPPLCPKLAIIK